jgi:hypothetical protein
MDDCPWITLTIRTPDRFHFLAFLEGHSDSNKWNTKLILSYKQTHQLECSAFVNLLTFNCWGQITPIKNNTYLTELFESAYGLNLLLLSIILPSFYPISTPFRRQNGDLFLLKFQVRSLLWESCIRLLLPRLLGISSFLTILESTSC